MTAFGVMMGRRFAHLAVKALALFKERWCNPHVNRVMETKRIDCHRVHPCCWAARQRSAIEMEFHGWSAPHTSAQRPRIAVAGGYDALHGYGGSLRGVDRNAGSEPVPGAGSRCCG